MEAVSAYKANSEDQAHNRVNQSNRVSEVILVGLQSKLPRDIRSEGAILAAVTKLEVLERGFDISNGWTKVMKE